MTDLRLDTALRLSRAGLPIIALYGPTEGDANQRGKRPRSHAWQVAKQTPEQLAAHFAQAPDSNLGCVTGLMSGLVLLDIDPRNGGGEWLRANVERVKADGAQVERTGSGGFHLWWAHPGAGLWVPSKTGKHGIAPGVELLADGGHQAVIAPSIHHTGTVYEWQGSMPFEDVRDFGAVLPGWIAVAAAMSPVMGSRRDRTVAEVYGDHPADVEACRARLEDFEPAVEGAGGDSQTFRACCFGRDHNLSPEAFRPLLQAWSARCSPPWGLEELERKLANGYGYSKAERAGQRAPSRAFSAVPASGQEVAAAPALAPAEAAAQVKALVPWRDRAVKNKDGTWKSHVRNVQLVFENDSRVSQSVRFNEFTSSVEVVLEGTARAPRAPWRKWAGAAAWVDDDDTNLASWIAEEYSAAMGSDVVHAAVRPYARTFRSYHPVRDYLRGLTWDGKPRLDTWTVRYLGAEDTPHHRAVGARFLLGAVARILHPGCQMDTMLVLEGEQGTGKSRAARTLFGEWFNDAMIDISHKDAALVIRGKWGVEFGEMHAVSRAEQTQIKAYLSRRSDRQRDSHDRCVSEHDRQCVFIGTTNQQFYQMDSTGGRRFWPVACARIDLGKLERDRDQLWAEALVRHERGEPHHLTAEEEAATQAEQGLRHLQDDWIERIEAWLKAHNDFDVSALSGITGLEIWVGALAGEVKHIRRTDQTRIAECMRRIGFKATVFRRNGVVMRGYVGVTTVTTAQL